MSTLFAFLFLFSIIGLCIGLVKPSIFKLKTRKQASLIFGVGIVLFLILQTITSPQNQSTVATVPARERATNTQATTTPSTQTTFAVPSAPQATTAKPTCELSVSPSSIAVGQSTKLAWTSSGVTDGSITNIYGPGDVDSNIVLNGRIIISPTATTNYVGTFTGPGGSATCQTTLTVIKSPATPTTQTDNQNTSPVSNETVSQKNAVAKATDYLNYSAFSHDGLVAQLEYDQFSHADAVYGADNSGANWNEQAAAKAKSYMSYSAFSRGGLIAQLEYDKFTQAQAEYGANAIGL